MDIRPLAALLFVAPAFGQIYQCGNTYSDQPCGPEAQELDIQTANPGVDYKPNLYQRLAAEPPPIQIHAAPRPAPRPAPRQDPVARHCPSENAIEEAVDDSRVVQCMTPDQVREAAPGVTYYVSTQVDDLGLFVEWSYRLIEPGWPVRIVFRNGRVFGYETKPVQVGP